MPACSIEGCDEAPGAVTSLGPVICIRHGIKFDDSPEGRAAWDHHRQKKADFVDRLNAETKSSQGTKT